MKIVILILILLAIAVPCAAQTPPTDLPGWMSGVDLTMVYFTSFNGNGNALIGKAGIELAEWPLIANGATLGLSISGLVKVAPDVSPGAGIDLTAKDLVKGLTFGLGWVSDLGVGGYVSFFHREF